MSIQLSYFSGSPIHMSTDAYIVTFRGTTTELASIIHGEWLQTLPYMEQFMQLIKRSPLTMNDGDVFVAKRKDPKNNVKNVIFIRNDAVTPKAALMLPALQEAIQLKCSVVSILFESLETRNDQEKFAFALYIILKHFIESNPTIEMEIRVNFRTTDSSAYQVFQEQGVPFLGVK